MFTMLGDPLMVNIKLMGTTRRLSRAGERDYLEVRHMLLDIVCFDVPQITFPPLCRLGLQPKVELASCSYRNLPAAALRLRWVGCSELLFLTFQTGLKSEVSEINVQCRPR